MGGLKLHGSLFSQTLSNAKRIANISSSMNSLTDMSWKYLIAGYDK